LQLEDDSFTASQNLSRERKATPGSAMEERFRGELGFFTQMDPQKGSRRRVK
jgi:hypothetical protein